MIKRLAPLVAVGTLLALLVAGSALAAAQKHRPRTIASCTASDGHPRCYAAGGANHPSSLWLHVSAKPRQKVSGWWEVQCTKGFPRDKKGRIRGTSTVTRRLPMSYAHPTYCVVYASAQLSKAGTSLHLWVTVRR
jgi:hypothetical protein